jgi:transcriptional regulator with PAS, ATPase and Fis domain
VIEGDLLAVAAVLAAAVGGFLIGRLRRPAASESADLPEADAPGDPRFEQLVREIGAGIVTVDARGRVTSLNGVAAAIFEIGGRRVLGKTLIEIVPSFDLDRRVREALAGRASRGQLPITVRQRGRMLNVTALPAEGVDGAILIAIDETRLYELEHLARVTHAALVDQLDDRNDPLDRLRARSAAAVLAARQTRSRPDGAIGRRPARFSAVGSGPLAAAHRGTRPGERGRQHRQDL